MAMDAKVCLLLVFHRFHPSDHLVPPAQLVPPRHEYHLLVDYAQAQTENDDTLALLDCLGEGAASEEGGPLREVCAKGIVEFLRYAIKQSSKRQQASAYCRS